MRVVVGVISRLDSQKRHEYLFSQRQKGKMFADKWEFPGGKIDLGETQIQALIRELDEELGIEVTEKACEKIMTIPYQNQGNLAIDLSAYRIKDYSGVPTGAEGQALDWKKISSLQDKDVPVASIGILNALRLPDYYAVTGEAYNQEDFIIRFKSQLRNYSFIQLRPSKTTQAYLQNKIFIDQLVPLVKNTSAQVLINASCLIGVKEGITAKDLLDLLLNSLPKGFAGWHLPSWVLTTLALDNIWLGDSRLGSITACSVHNQQQIYQANNLGVSFMCLGPVYETPSHPRLKETLGLNRFSELCTYAIQPVFAIGGMDRRKVTEVKALLGQGVAAIKDSW